MLGVFCGLAAGAWLGMAEAPTKLVTVGFSPFLISLGMVAGVFVARWTVPMALKGTSLHLGGPAGEAAPDRLGNPRGNAVGGGEHAHRVRDPQRRVIDRVSACGIRTASSACSGAGCCSTSCAAPEAGRGRWCSAGLRRSWLARAYSRTRRQLIMHPRRTLTARRRLGIFAAVGAGMMWGTMYIPYRKAYISGMNPLSFVTVFTFGELGTVFALAAAFDGGVANVFASLDKARPALFWLFLGGFCWVLGDLFQQYAAKYIGIGRGIPLSNTNQLWGLAWGALVFGEFAGLGSTAQTLVIAGSLVMIAGAVAISFAEAPESEQESWRNAMDRECTRYGLDRARVAATVEGGDPLSEGGPRRRHWWEAVVGAGALALFVWLAMEAEKQAIAVSVPWMAVLIVASLVLLIACGTLLWKRTKFS